MLSFVSITKSISFSFIMAFAVFGAAFTATSIAQPSTAEAGVLKKGKKGLKLVGKSARWVEKKTAKMGKVGKVVSKGARGVRKGAGKASRGVSKVQRGAKKAFGKVCKRNCQKVVKVTNKVRKGLDRLQDNVERKCAQFGRNSKACSVAREALAFASPL